MSPRVETETLLSYARQLCDSREWQTGFWASRAAALLTRQAMERSLLEYWEATNASVAHVSSMRAAFLLLNAHVDPPAPAHAYAVWSRLSHACHYRPLDLPPSREEALGWIEDTQRFRDLLLQAHRRAR